MRRGLKRLLFNLNAGGGYEAEAAALFARFTTPPDATRKGHINTLIKTLKTAGIWSKLDAFYVMAAADSQAARQNWVADQYNLTAVSSPVFTTDRGYQGDAASSYLETNFNPTTAVSPKFVQNSGHFSFWSLTALGSSGGVDAGNGNTLLVQFPASFSHRVNTATSGAIGLAAQAGSMTSSRTGSTGADNVGYRNATAVVAANTSAAPDNSSIRLLGRSGTISYSSRQGAAASIGSGLTAGEVTSLYNARLAFLQAVGAA